MDDALVKALSLINPIAQTETIYLAKATGRILATDICARKDAPQFDTSAVDGFAVSVDRLQGPGPWTLLVGGRIAAGDPIRDQFSDALAVQIFTGARVPEGLDAVIMQEDVERFGQQVMIAKRPKPNLNIRKAGEKYHAGQRLLSAGVILGPIEIACAAASGVDRVNVRRKLRASLIVTGNELKSAGDGLEGSDIWDVNTPMLQAHLADPKVEIIEVIRLSDSRDNLSRALGRLARTSDILIVSGSASVGEEDHLHAAIKGAGGAVAISGVAMKPGKPVTFGMIGKTLLIGLPGNPVAACVTWKILGRPVLDFLAGHSNDRTTARHVKAGHSLTHSVGRCDYRPARVVRCDASGIEVIEADQATHSGRMTSLLGADGLVRIPSFVELIERGDLLEFIPF